MTLGTFEGSPEQIRLCYDEIVLGKSGGILTNAQKRKARERAGYCLDCQGLPVLLYTVKKGPLRLRKEARTVAGECADGVCFQCFPLKDPSLMLSRKINGKVASKRGNLSVPIVNSRRLDDSFKAPSLRSLKSNTSTTVAESISSCNTHMVPSSLLDLPHSLSLDTDEKSNESTDVMEDLSIYDVVRKRPSEADDEEVIQPVPPPRRTEDLPNLAKEASSDSQSDQEEGTGDEADGIIADLDTILEDLARSNCCPNVFVEIILAALQEHEADEKVQAYCLERLEALER